MAINLTTLPNLRAWIGSAAGDDDLILKNLITSTSRAILSFIMRPNIFMNAYNETYDGCGTTRIYLKNYPVISVSSVTIGFQTVLPYVVPPLPAPTTDYGLGYVIDPWDGTPPGGVQALSLRGVCFNKGQSNINVQYMAGYAVQNEAQTVPSTNSSTPAPSVRINQNYGNWGQDGGVTYSATGIAMTGSYYNESTVAALSAGNYQYKADGTYYFSAADATIGVLISYSFIPSDIEQACFEMIAERYKYRDRIGQKSKSLAGQETISYDNSGMTKYIMSMLQPYKRCTFA